MNVLDLFCGCGGFSLGFEQAGHQIKYAIDNWKGCQETFEYNHPNTEFILGDIRNLNHEDFKNIDIIIGSPPCQQFSVANNNPDPELGMQLVKEFIKWVVILKPKYWIMENVPGVKKYLIPLIPKIPLIKILNCADFGVPQKRKRCFSGDYIIPFTTHNKIQQQTLTGEKLEKWVTVSDAIGDIMFIEPNQPNFRLKIPNHNCFDNMKEINYESANREVKIEEPAAVVTSKDRCKKKLELSQVRNPFTSGGNSNFYKPNVPSRTITNIPPSIVLGRKRGIALNPKHKDYRKDVPNKPATGMTTQPLTIQNKEGKIYRRLTVRECARLQSFPDDFIFFGSLSSQYKMVGNAVPPMMALAFAKALKNNNDSTTIPIQEFIIYINKFFEKYNLPLKIVKC